MNTTITLLIPCVTLLVACVGVENATVNVDGTSISGGNSSSSSSSSSNSSGSSSNGSDGTYGGAGVTSPNFIFSSAYTNPDMHENTGIALGVASTGMEDEQEVLVVGGSIASMISAANSEPRSNLVTAIENVNVNDLPLVRNNSYSNLRAGTYSVNGQTFSVKAITDTQRGEAVAMFFQMPRGQQDVSVVTGTAYSYQPEPHSLYTYRGTQVSQRHNSEAPGSTGTFTLKVNFADETFVYEGSSGSDSVTARGYFSRNVGRFYSSYFDMSGSTGKLQGQIHGSEATSTSGVFHQNGSRPRTGVFVGSR